MTITKVARAERLSDSARKIRPPFSLDPSLCFYSPQDNLDGMDHPEVAAFHAFARDEWEPPPTPGGHAPNRSADTVYQVQALFDEP